MEDRFKFKFVLYGKVYEIERLYLKEKVVEYIKNKNNKLSVLREDISEGKLIQCIGLKDKNNNFIYEGDIVKDGYHNIGVINYDNKCAMFKIQCNNGNFFLRQYEESEIIGNIYENKELLEK